jgi:hypothetical protein
MHPKMMQDLFEPPLTGEFLGANFVLVIDAFLLDLSPVVAAAAAEQVGPSNVVLKGNEQLETCFAVVGGHVEKRVVLESTLDADHEDCLQIWLSSWLRWHFERR